MAPETVIPAATGVVVTYLWLRVAWKGFRAHERREAEPLARAPLTAVEHLWTGDTGIAVAGRARRADTPPLDVPLGDGEAFVAVTQFDEQHSVGAPNAVHWRSVHSETNTVPFLIEGDTGEAVVDLHEDVDTDLERQSVAVDGGEEPPAGIRQLLDRTDGVDPSAGGYQWYEQAAVGPGDRVFVFGLDVVEESDGRPVLVPSEDTGTVVTDDPPLEGRTGGEDSDDGSDSDDGPDSDDSVPGSRARRVFHRK